MDEYWRQHRHQQHRGAEAWRYSKAININWQFKLAVAEKSSNIPMHISFIRQLNQEYHESQPNLIAVNMC